MIGIIVVFPSRENAANIRNLLVRYGMTVSGVCTTGAQAMNHADALDAVFILQLARTTRMHWMKESWSADTS